jgi:hypothetical protein
VRARSAAPARLLVITLAAWLASPQLLASGHHSASPVYPSCMHLPGAGVPTQGRHLPLRGHPLGESNVIMPGNHKAACRCGISSCFWRQSCTSYRTWRAPPGGRLANYKLPCGYPIWGLAVLVFANLVLVYPPPPPARPLGAPLGTSRGLRSPMAMACGGATRNMLE